MRLTAMIGFSVLYGLAILQPSLNPAAKEAEQDRADPQVRIPRIEVRAEDVSSIDGIIRAYYQVVSGPAGQPREWGRDATLYIPGVRFVVFSKDKNGRTTAQSMTHQEFVDASDRAMVTKGFYEREIHRITHRAGDAAHVLSTAESSASPSGPAQARSIDSLELYWDGMRWWIASANVWELGSDESLPAEFLP
jgi:hypothetical protein